MLRRMLWVVGLACVAAGVAGGQAAPARGRALYGRLPLTFEQNTGRYDKRVRFLARTGGGTLFLTDREAVLSLPVRTPQAPAQARRRPGPPMPGMPEPPAPARRSVLRMKLAGSAGAASAMGLQRQKGIVNYFIGNDPKKWRTRVPTFARVKMAGVYPGIDLVYYGSPDRALEYDFVVKPGSDPGRIRLAFSGARKLALAANGDLIATTEAGDVRLKRPYAYQQIGGKRVQVACSYSLKSQEARMQVAQYDAARPLVVDPVLVYGTFVGGSIISNTGQPSSDSASAIAVDNAGCAYMTGSTTSADFPVTNNTWDQGDGSDTFVVKINQSGSSLLYSIYFCATGQERSASLVLTGNGKIYISLWTDAMWFPTSTGSFHSDISGPSDAYIAQLSEWGTWQYGTYLGGTGSDGASGIAVDGAGNVYVSGWTNSTDFPVTSGAFQTAKAGASDDVSDGYVAKLSATPTLMQYGTYIGGSRSDSASAIAVDSGGYAFVTGFTQSTDFPTTIGAYQLSNAGGPNDAFVARLNAAGSALAYCTLLGGSGSDMARDIAIDTTGCGYIAGTTTSRNYPAVGGAFTTYGGGSADGFVAKLDAQGSRLVYGTYVGGSGGEWSPSIAVDGGGCAYVGGWTNSTDFPVPGAVLTGIAGSSDAFVAKLNADGSRCVFGTYFGGSGDEGASDIAIDSAGCIYLAGYTASADFPATPGAFQTKMNGPNDAFVAKIVLGDVLGAQLVVEGATGKPGASVTLLAHLAALASNEPITGRPLVFRVAGDSAGTATTDASGTARVNCVVPEGGPHVVSATFAGDADYDAFQSTATLAVAPADTFTYVVDRNGVISESIRLKAWLKRLTDNAWLPDRSLAFSIAGTQVGAAATDASGMAYLDWVVAEASGPRAITASFTGSAEYLASAGEAVLTVQPVVSTTLTLPDRAAELADTTLLKAYLYRDDQAPIEGKAVTFHVDGTEVGSATSNYQGRAMLLFTVPGPTAPGRHDLEARWAGNGGYLASSGSAALWVSRAPSYLWLASRTIKQGGAAYLRSYLRRLPDYVWLPGKAVSYKLDGVALGSATTDGSGCASLLYNAPAGMALGGHTMVATFGGDATYIANGSSGVLTVTP